jgi:hypothetical protein
MAEKKRLFRRVLDAIVDGRSRQAQRYVDSYLTDHDMARPRKN